MFISRRIILGFTFIVLYSNGNQLTAMAAENCFAPQQQQNLANETQTAFPFKTGAENRVSDTEYQMWHSRCVLDISDDKQKANNGFVFVDVRSRVAYQNGHIPNSLNIPLYEIKTKKYLKNKPLLLINEGYERKSLVLACMQLREAGFRKAFVLKEGLLEWEKKFGPLKQNTRHSPFYLMPAKSLFYERETRPWLVLNASTNRNSRIQQYFPHILNLKSINNVEKVRGLIKKLKQSAGDYSIVVVDQDGSNINAFNRLYTALAKTDVYYLQGGVEQFDRFVNSQYAMLSKKEFVLQKPKSCSR